jgi:hypothetical protein
LADCPASASQTCGQRRNFLGVKKKLDELEWNVTEIELEHGVSAGILLRSLSEDSIPLYYEHVARTKAGKTLSEWERMDRMDKAMAVAIMLISNSIEGHQAEAEIKNAERRIKRN